MRSVYSFRVDRPINRDAHVLTLIRYDLEGEPGDEDGKGFVFTTDRGWVEFEPWATLDQYHLPDMAGIEMWQRKNIDTKLDEWTARVKVAMADVGIELRVS